MGYPSIFPTGTTVYDKERHLTVIRFFLRQRELCLLI